MSEEAEVEESIEFTAQAHYDHITDILMSFYDIEEPEDWITNQTADSASVNIKLAKLLGVAHINCENHLLNNEVKLWLMGSTANEDDIPRMMRNFVPGTVCKIIHNTMLDLKTNKNRAILRQTTDLSPTIGNETRWGSSHNMLSKWHQRERDCELASAHEDATFSMLPPSYAFKEEAKNTSTMLSDINDVAEMLQKCLLPLHRSRVLTEY